MPRDSEDRGGTGKITEARLTTKGTGHDGESERTQDLESEKIPRPGQTGPAFSLAPSFYVPITLERASPTLVPSVSKHMCSVPSVASDPL